METGTRNRLYKCEHCSRYFTRKTYFDKHVLCCKVLTTSRREAKLECEELKDTPNLRELYLLVQNLTLTCEKQKKEINSLKKYVEKTKKMLNIVDWLNENYKTCKDFNEWLNSITVTRFHIENIFKHDLVQGFMHIIQENLPLENHDLAIKCFDQKNGIFFIFDKKQSWKTMTGVQFEKMINVINMKIMCEFKVWQKENEKNILNGNFGDNYYQQCVIKILGGDKSKSIIHNKIKSKLYNYLKFNLKRIIQFEFN